MAAVATKDEATRTRILNAAVTVFSEVGYAAATVRQICTKAEVNVAAVNYHFGDKLGLYTEVLRRSSGADAQLKIRAAITSAGSPEDALRIFVRGMFEKIYGEHPEANQRIMAQEIVNPSPAFDEVVDQVMRPQYNQLCELVGKIIGTPATAEATRLCVHSLVGQIMHYAQSQELIARVWPKLNLTRQRHRIADHIVTFTIAGLAASRSTPSAGKAK